MAHRLVVLLFTLSLWCAPVAARPVAAAHSPQPSRTAAAPFSSAMSLSAGRDHTCAVTERGGVMCWGDNTYGQLGDGTTVKRTLPVGVAGLGAGSGVTAVAAGGDHTCALTATGGVKCWGANSRGQLGNGGWEPQLTPVDVIGFGAARRAVALAAGYAHTCALTATGGVLCWGNNNDGQLGNGTTQSRTQPVQVVGLTGSVMDLSAGWAHTCAVTAEGGAQCWGNNQSGQVGVDTPVAQRIPVDVPGLGAGNGVTRIAAGETHTCAAVAGGAMCWGSNSYGEMGIGQRDWITYPPMSVLGLGPGSGVSAVAAGEYYSCALTAAGETRCWGRNLHGQLGDGTRTDRDAPVHVVGLDAGDAGVIVTGLEHTCALMDGGILCWGSNESGQLGNGAAFPILTPVWTTGFPVSSEILAVATGGAHTCALAHGGVSCWGTNSDGELGDDTQTERFRRADVRGLEPGGAVTAVVAGGAHTCAVVAGGAQCWGDNRYGQLGDGTTENRLTPVNVVGLGPGSGVTSVSAGQEYTCAVKADGAVLCWGRNGDGQLGDGTKLDRRQPVNVVGLGPGSGTLALSAGDRHTCAVAATGALCWGANYNGQLGDGSAQERLSPVAVVGLDANRGVTAISAGSNHTCALVAGGAMCWGNNYSGALGDGSDERRLTPVNVQGLGPGSGVTKVAAMHDRSCAMRAGGVQCWGDNYSGGLGDGTETNRFSPVDVVGSGPGAGVTDVAGGGYHTCTVVQGGLQCWGSNYFGQLGINPGWEPTAVAGFIQGTPRPLYLPQIFR